MEQEQIQEDNEKAQTLHFLLSTLKCLLSESAFSLFQHKAFFLLQKGAVKRELEDIFLC